MGGVGVLAGFTRGVPLRCARASLRGRYDGRGPGRSERLEATERSLLGARPCSTNRIRLHAPPQACDDKRGMEEFLTHASTPSHREPRPSPTPGVPLDDRSRGRIPGPAYRVSATSSPADSPSFARGSVTRKVVPAPSSLSNEIAPW
jgi:hypothetical protein